MSVLQDDRLRREVEQRARSAKAMLRGPSAPRGPEGVGAPPPGPLPEVTFGQLSTAGIDPEKLILLVGRPSILIQDDSFNMTAFGTLAEYFRPAQKALERSLRSVGRVEFGLHPRLAWGGTAWMVAPRVAITNRHVAEEVVYRANDGKLRWRPGTAPGRSMWITVDFKEEYERGARHEVEALGVEYLAAPDEADIALLIFPPGARLPPPIPLSKNDPAGNAWLAAVGYPAFDGYEDPGPMSEVFKNIYDVKRFAPGNVKQIFPEGYFTHDCTTLGGNSGSVMLDASTGEAVGLHFGGRSRVANYAVSAMQIRAVLDKAGLKADDRVSVPVSATLELEEEKSSAPTVANYKGRPGYSAKFLGGDPIPLPNVINANDCAPLLADNTKVELEYRHFSVVMSVSRRLAFFTAVNINGDGLRRPARKNDRWYYDPRIDKDHQVGNELYVDNDLDRGHLVRRLDPVWGEPYREAMEDTFHFTNCAPQHADLNQKTWNDLEDYILDNAGAHELRVTVFTGPVFHDKDPIYRGLQLPRSFWKVVVMRDGESAGKPLRATAYLLSQANLLADIEEEFVYGPYRTYQVRVADLQSRVHLLFDDAVVNADPLGQQEAVDTSRELLSPRDIKLRP